MTPEERTIGPPPSASHLPPMMPPESGDDGKPVFMHPPLHQEEARPLQQQPAAVDKPVVVTPFLPEVLAKLNGGQIPGDIQQGAAASCWTLALRFPAMFWTDVFRTADCLPIQIWKDRGQAVMVVLVSRAARRRQAAPRLVPVIPGARSSPADWAGQLDGRAEWATRAASSVAAQPCGPSGGCCPTCCCPE